jgi:flagellar basal body-associated protein FliL
MIKMLLLIMLAVFISILFIWTCIKFYYFIKKESDTERQELENIRQEIRQHINIMKEEKNE